MAHVLWMSVEVPDQHGQGGQRRQYHQIAALAAHGHRITVVSPASARADASVRAVARVHRPRLHVRGRHVPFALGRLQRMTQSDRWDAIVVSHHGSAWMLPARSRRPVLLDIHNVMSWAMQQRGDQAAVEQSMQSESRALDRAWGVMTCSDAETARLVAMHPGVRDRVFTAPLGVDPAEWPLRPYDRAQPQVALFGGWAWDPNRRGLQWFVEQVWPALARAHPSVRGRIAGSGLDPALQLPDGLEFVGRVPDLADFTASATVVAVPVLDGVGAAMKFVESLASGASVIATPDAASAFPEADCRVSSDAAEWASWIADRLARRGVEPVPAPERQRVLAARTWADAVLPIEQWLAASSGAAEQEEHR